MTKLLDWAKALEDVDGSEEILNELAQVFLDECPGMMKQIRTALDAKNSTDLQRSAHSLKGSARIFKAEPASKSALRLETMGRDNDFAESEKAWTALNEEVDRLNSALSKQLGSQSEK